MRTAILLGAMIIASSIGDKKQPEKVHAFVGLILAIAMFMDLMEFIMIFKK